MKATVWITFGRVGFGVTRQALFPEIRCGLFAVGWCRGALADHLAAFRASARAAWEMLL